VPGILAFFTAFWQPGIAENSNKIKAFGPRGDLNQRP
jgi:hypothetical protein